MSKKAGKGSQASSSSGPSQSSSQPAEEKKPIAKGHRQRGAGTVITGKAAIVTADGVTLKAHERLPFQLLHEFYQREKRPIPKYQQCPKDGREGFRMRVLLEDAKNSKNDLTFCPVQSFESETVAKDYAALLALFHFQKNLPLERKLPHPYSHSWLQLISGNTSTVSAEVAGSSEGKEESPPPEPAAVVVTAVDSATANWLCSTCGAENTALTLQGNVRRKCFKCQTAKSDACIVVSSTASSKSTSSKEGAKDDRVVVKAAPQLVQGLAADRQFASQSAAEQASLSGKREKNKLLSYADAVRKANTYATLSLPPSILQQLTDLSSQEDALAFLRSSSSVGYVRRANSTWELLQRCGYDLSTFSTELQRAVDDWVESLPSEAFPFQAPREASPEPLIEQQEQIWRGMLLQGLLCPQSAMEVDYGEEPHAQLEVLEGVFGEEFSVLTTSAASLWTLRCGAFQLSLPSPEQSLRMQQDALRHCGWQLASFLVTSEDGREKHSLQLATKTKCIGQGVFDICAAFREAVQELEETGRTKSLHRVDTVRVLRLLDGTSLASSSESVTVDGEVPESHELGKESFSTKAAAKPSKARKVHPFWLPLRASPVSSVPTQEMTQVRQALPAFEKREEFLQAFGVNQCVIVTGETGSGKTTQIPQYIVEAHRQKRVVVCQPRRLAATAVAERIAQETNTPLGQRVGYMVKGAVQATTTTQILFLTYGVLLRRIQEDPALQAIDCVILDEVHERGVDSDFTLALLLQALRRRPALQLVLMSATISTEKFQDYLHGHLHPAQPVPVLSISGRTFPVKEHFRDDFEAVVRCFPLPEPAASPGVVIPKKVRDIDYELILRLVLALISNWDGREALGQALTPTGSLKIDEQVIQKCSFQSQMGGAILIFLTGVQEIDRMITLLRAYFSPTSAVQSLVVLPLHSNLSAREQQQIFKSVPARTVKIICATNIAEASVTIPDVTVVIDSCKVKQMDFDESVQTNRLVTILASRQNLIQRQGRAGRVSAGRVYKCITKNAYYNTLPATSNPEILRMSLDSVVLQAWGMQRLFSSMEKDASFSAYCVLKYCLDSPSLQSVRITENRLCKIRALEIVGEDDEGNEVEGQGMRVSSLGQTLLQLACTAQVGRLLVMGAKFHCVYDAAILAAMLTCRPPWVYVQYGSNGSGEKGRAGANATTNPENDSNRQRVEATMMEFSSACTVSKASGAGSGGSRLRSDMEVMLRVVTAFEDHPQPRKFCNERGLVWERMQELRDCRDELLTDLMDTGLIPRCNVRSMREHDKNRCGVSYVNSPVADSARLSLLHSVCVSGLYPNIAFVLRPAKRFVEVMGSALEKDVQATDIRLFVPVQSLDSTSDNRAESAPIESSDMRDLSLVLSTGVGGLPSTEGGNQGRPAMRKAAVHPSSLNASNTTFSTCNYLVYGNTFLTGGAGTEEPTLWLQNTAEILPWALVLFGGKVHWKKSATSSAKSEGEGEEGVLVIDEYIRFSCTWAVFQALRWLQQDMDSNALRREEDGLEGQDRESGEESGGWKVVVDLLSSSYRC